MASTLFIPGTVVRSIWLNEVDKATHNALTAVAGTNTITATGPATSLAYVTGDRFFFVPASSNTGATTININGLGAKNITKYGVTALIAGDLVASTAAEIYYDGVQFQLLNPQTVNTNTIGRLINVQTFVASGNYTPTAGTTRVYVECWGGGGAGGGCAATAAAQVAIGGGGGAGGYCSSFFTSGFSGVPYVIGAAGAPGAAGAGGGSGGSTTFLTMTAAGGGGGPVGSVGASSVAGVGGGGVASGGNIINITGQTTPEAIATTTPTSGVSGSGGPSNVGSNGQALAAGFTSAGTAASGRAAGGSGARGFNGNPAQVGGAGSGGLIRIFEYS